MIFITATFAVRPEHAEQWPELSRTFTEAVLPEPGCLWSQWSRSFEDPCEDVLVEAFRDADAGAEHVRSEHFRAAQRELPAYLASTPKVVNAEVPGVEWSLLGEMQVDEPA